MSLLPTGTGWKVWSPRRNVFADAVPVPSRAVGTVPERSVAEPLVAMAARPVILLVAMEAEALMSALTMVPSAILSDVTAESAILAVVTLPSVGVRVLVTLGSLASSLADSDADRPVTCDCATVTGSEPAEPWLEACVDGVRASVSRVSEPSTTCVDEALPAAGASLVAAVPTPSSLVLSAADIEPAADVVAAAMLTTGVVVPVATAMGAVPVTLVTVPDPALASTHSVS